ncbi:hypothetical protein D5086_031255 [Populus alba]|uniref:Uncharacterized protein n=1 Tax=Populus alba TaxID=43335 RepID=A0ACC4AQS9_POPAL
MDEYSSCNIINRSQTVPTPVQGPVGPQVHGSLTGAILDGTWTHTIIRYPNNNLEHVGLCHVRELISNGTLSALPEKKNKTDFRWGFC